ncbi:MAG: DNA polymerase III subunit delta' [Smithellaceae bacterium]|nr:DNA polymerase III subunit delta' [Smithellaceae bacterium]
MKWQDIYGHEKHIAVLRSAMEKDRIAHAYLFYGTAGIGKRTTALTFATALNCPLASESQTPCGECPSCRKIAHGNHSDVSTLVAEGQFIRIKAIRDLQDQMKFRPFEGKNRVFIIAQADKLNNVAANALLKTLEEPSPANILILTTSRLHLLPQTILSRCQHVRFNPLPEQTVHAYLKDSLSLSDQELSVLAASSGGSIAKALALSRESYLELRDEIIARLSGAELQAPLQRLYFAALIGNDKKDVISRLEIMKSCYRDAVVYAERGAEGRLVNQDRSEVIEGIARRIATPELIRNLAVIEKASSAIEQNANKALTLEAMMFRLAF